MAFDEGIKKGLTFNGLLRGLEKYPGYDHEECHPIDSRSVGEYGFIPSPPS